MGKVSEFYCGKNILVTGATGFCGKVLVEKLLRSCGSAGKIYILVRPKKNATPQERFVGYVNHFIFDGLRKSNEKFADKLVLISGDITVDGLDMSEQDQRALINDVNIIFHCAANVKFNDALKQAVNINATGTLRILQLAERVKNLLVFSYMSTSFCQAYQNHLEERYYPSNLDVFGIIKKTRSLSEETLNDLENELINHTKHPNTYTLSKALAEDIVHSFHKKFPIVIIRPSLVWYAINEPIKGFIEGLHSGIGIICGGMTGFLRTMHVGATSAAKITPADYMINATIASVWKRSVEPSDELLIFNCTDAEENPLQWNETFSHYKGELFKYVPYEKLVWYPNINFTSSYTWHMISLFLFQLLPAFLVDIFRALIGSKTMFTRLQLKIIDGMSYFYFFTTKNFHFETIKLQKLFSELDGEDRQKFCFDHTTIDWNVFFRNGMIETRRRLLHDDDATIPKAQEKLKKLYFLDLSVKVLFFGGLLFFLFKFFVRMENNF